MDQLSIVLFLIIFLLPIVGVGMLFSARSIEKRHERNYRLGYPPWLTSIIAAVLAVLFITAIALSIQHRNPIWVPDLANIMTIAICIGLTAAMTATVVLGIRLESNLRAEARGDESATETITQNAYSARFLGWIFVGMPLLLFVPLAALVVTLPVFPPVIAFIVMTIHKRKRQAQLLWLLTISVENNIPLADEVEALAKTIRWRRSRRRTHELAELLREGMPLTDALHRFPGLLPRHAVIAAGIGNEANSLDQSLRESAVRHTSAMQLAAESSSSVWFAVYIFALFSCILLLLLFQFNFIVPKIKSIYQGFGLQLPWITQSLVDLGDNIDRDLILYIPLISAPVLFMMLLAAIYYWGWGNLNIPMISRHFRRTDTPWLLRSLAYSIVSKLPIPAGVRSIADYQIRHESRLRLKRIADSVSSGRECWDALIDERLINDREALVLRSAQRANNLPWALRELADSIETKFQYRVMYWIEFLKPLFVALIGLIVMFVCIAFFMPIVDLIGRV